jgi:hypothetical protein
MPNLTTADVERFFRVSTISPFPYPDDVAMMGAALDEHGVAAEDVLVATRFDEGYTTFVMFTRAAAISAHKEGVFKKRLISRIISLAGVDGMSRDEREFSKFESNGPGGSIALTFTAAEEPIHTVTWAWREPRGEAFARGEEARLAAAFGVTF